MSISVANLIDCMIDICAVYRCIAVVSQIKLECAELVAVALLRCNMCRNWVRLKPSNSYSNHVVADVVGVADVADGDDGDDVVVVVDQHSTFLIDPALTPSPLPWIFRKLTGEMIKAEMFC